MHVVPSLERPANRRCALARIARAALDSDSDALCLGALSGAVVTLAILIIQNAPAVAGWLFN